jgi:hypothetical protein
MNYKDITPTDEYGRLHGYCEKYYDDGSLMWKGVSVDGYWRGYIENYYIKGNKVVDFTGYYSNGNYILEYTNS